MNNNSSFTLSRIPVHPLSVRDIYAEHLPMLIKLPQSIQG